MSTDREVPTPIVDAAAMAIRRQTVAPTETALDLARALERRNSALVEALERFTDAAARYMSYHEQKFYGHGIPNKPSGLNPEIAMARKVLAANKEPPC